MKNIYGKIRTFMDTDDESITKINENLIHIYNSATKDQKAKIDMFTINLCGYSMKTLLNDKKIK